MRLLFASILGLSSACAHEGAPSAATSEQEGPLTSPQADPAGDPMQLPESPSAAVAQLQAASKDGPIAVFKHSPICPVSTAANFRFKTWMGEGDTASKVKHAQIDVIAEKPLARGLVAELGIQHESPQLLLFHGGELVWHASHGAITGDALSEQLALLD